jgi:hypothetical protein
LYNLARLFAVFLCAYCRILKAENKWESPWLLSSLKQKSQMCGKEEELSLAGITSSYTYACCISLERLQFRNSSFEEFYKV